MMQILKDDGMGSGFAVIPDLHAAPRRLARSLEAAGFERDGETWGHPDGVRALFLGDLIDAQAETEDADDRAVVEAVMGMVERGRALCLMGNHEFNAVLWHRRDRSGRPLRRHDAANRAQHESFLASYAGDEVGRRRALHFFESLPFQLDLGVFRAVHACWDEASISRLAAISVRSASFWERAADERGGVGAAAARLVKGPEVRLPEGVSYLDVNGQERDRARLRWWVEPRTLAEALASMPEGTRIPDMPWEDRTVVETSPGAPILFGHYKVASVEKMDRAICLDAPGRPVVAMVRASSIEIVDVTHRETRLDLDTQIAHM
jgi:hypothetical protein